MQLHNRRRLFFQQMCVQQQKRIPYFLNGSELVSEMYPAQTGTETDAKHEHVVNTS